MNRTTKHLFPIITLASAALAGVLASAPQAAADGNGPPQAPPAEIQKLFSDLSGTWEAREVTARMGPQSVTGTSRVSCEKAAAGWALRCRVTIQLGKRTIDEADLFGWDHRTGELTMFCVNNIGEAHEHRGKLHGNTIQLEHRGNREGKPYREEISMALAGKELRWQSSWTHGDQRVFEAAGTYRR